MFPSNSLIFLGKVVRYNKEEGMGFASTAKHGKVGLIWQQIVPFEERRNNSRNLVKDDEIIFDISENVPRKLSKRFSNFDTNLIANNIKIQNTSAVRYFPNSRRYPKDTGRRTFV